MQDVMSVNQKEYKIVKLLGHTLSFCWLLCTAYGTGCPWSQNADIDVDQRNCAYQAGSTSHDHIIWWFRIYGTAVRWIYASAWMDTGFLWIYELFCGCKSVYISVGVHVESL